MLFFFHFSDKYSRRVRDLHLLKKLSAVLDQVKHEEGLFLEFYFFIDLVNDSLRNGFFFCFQVLKGRALEKLQTSVLEILTSIQVPILLQQVNTVNFHVNNL